VKVLWVKSGGFLPLDAGAKIRSFNLARELATRHEVSLFTFYSAMTPDPHFGLGAPFQEAEYIPLDVSERTSVHDIFTYAANSVSNRPYHVAKYCRPDVAHRLRNMLSRRRYDVVLCDLLDTAGVIPWNLGIPIVMFTHNVDATIWKRHILFNNNFFWKAVSVREHRAVGRFERRFTALADHVLTVSDADRNEFLKHLPADKVSTIPTGVDPYYFRPQTNASLEHSLVFTGSMNWKPNEDAVFYFAASILPLIRKLVPNVTLRVVGRSPSRKLVSLQEGDSAIQLTGTVEDIRPYVHDSSVYVVPLRIGGGTRIKIFEAMAMGVPVVSTTIGAEGLPVEHRRNILLADNPEKFAAHVVELLTQPVLRERIAREARSLVESRYSWAAAAEVLERVLRQIVQSLCMEVNA